MNIQLLDEQGMPASDALYCAGHSPLPDGRILFAGGSRYMNLGMPTEVERGINYGRLFNTSDGTFSRIPFPMTGGPLGHKGVRWYPTLTRLPDSRTLVTGGFIQCCGWDFGNVSIETFRVRDHDKGKLPWQLLVSHDDDPPDFRPGSIDYTHVHLLPQPIPAKKENQVEHQIAMMGGSGEVILFNYSDQLPGKDRFTTLPHGKRQGGGEGSTGALLPTGKILVIGGKDDPTTAQRADLYDPLADSWSSVNTGISRFHPSSVLLPNGSVLIINGESHGGFVGDRRQPQIFDPITHKVTTLPPWPHDPNDRGYHNIAILLKDGRILIGGGRVWTQAEIGCERPDVRIYSPPYLFQNPRPSLTNVQEPIPMTVAGDQVTLTFVNGPLRAGTGVVLMALGSITHAFDQNQRYVPLNFKSLATGTIQVSPPKDYFQAPAGDYILFLINDLGIPSEGKHVQLI